MVVVVVEVVEVVVYSFADLGPTMPIDCEEEECSGGSGGVGAGS